jgi:DICT domain-containing protein
MVADDTPSSIRDFFDDVSSGDVSLVTINRTKPKPVQGLLADAFSTQSIDLVERSLPRDADDIVALRKDGEITAVSPLTELMRSFLLVNADRFKTGTDGFDDEIPDVLEGMDETLFDLRGYPTSNKEKLLLILISRHIERMAYEAADGRLRSTFQRLSRLKDEFGTRTVYERLAGRTVDVHVYGVPDRVPEQLDVTVHRGTSDEYRNSWCVVYQPPDNGEGAALIAHQQESNRWQGFWTYDPTMIDRVDRYLDRSF